MTPLGALPFRVQKKEKRGSESFLAAGVIVVLCAVVEEVRGGGVWEKGEGLGSGGVAGCKDGSEENKCCRVVWRSGL